MPLQLKEAIALLRPLHFSARVQRSGKNRGWKFLVWTTQEGQPYYRDFAPKTTWEEIIEYAKTLPSPWDKAMMFEKGDLIELDSWWGKKERIQALVLEVGCPTPNHYELYSLSFPEKSHIRSLGNHDLKFHKNAEKIGHTSVINLPTLGRRQKTVGRRGDRSLF
jgi:hypothetical protein